MSRPSIRYNQGGSAADVAAQILAAKSDTTIDRDDAARGVVPTAAEYPTPPNPASALVVLDDKTLELWEYDGTAWTIDTTIEPPERHLNSQSLAGPINADAILADFVIGEAFHFHTVGDVTFNTAGTIATVINGEANASIFGPTTADFGAGIRGILSKTSSGVRVEYVTSRPTAPIYDGVVVDAAPAWEDGLIMADDQTRPVETGLDLLKDVDHILVSFTRDVTATGDDLWPCPVRRIRIKDISQGVTQGMLLSHFDNQFLAVTTTTEAQLKAGRINFQAQSQSNVFGYEITRIEFRKRVIGAEPLIGFKIEGPPNLETQIKGVLEIRERTVTNGALDNPVFAARWPSLVDGNDIVIPADFEGAFSRNLGGNAADFETFQDDATAVNGLAGAARFNRGENTTANGGAFRLTGTGSEITANVTFTGDAETRPDNYAMQWYFIMDDYVSPSLGGGGGTTLNNAVANMTTQNSAPAAGTDLVMDNFTSLSGGVTINAAGDEFTLPQSDTLYNLKAIMGFDFDGSPVGAWEVEWFSNGAVIADSQEAQFRAFASGGHSQPEYFNPSATALVDASAGPVVVSLRVTTGGATGIDITRAFVEIEQKATSSTQATPAQIVGPDVEVFTLDQSDWPATPVSPYLMQRLVFQGKQVGTVTEQGSIATFFEYRKAIPAFRLLNQTVTLEASTANPAPVTQGALDYDFTAIVNQRC